MKLTASALALLVLAVSAAAQVKNPIATALKDTLPGRQKNTEAAVEEMPADKFGYKPTPDQMTFGHLVAHMIEANYLLCSKTASVAAPKVEEAKETGAKVIVTTCPFCKKQLVKASGNGINVCDVTELVALSLE